MKRVARWRAFVVLILFAVSAAAAKEKGKVPPASEEAVPPAAPSAAVPAAILSLATVKEGSLPEDTTALQGKWTVEAGLKVLQVAPDPLLDGWLEFGPEIREKGATIVASGKAPGQGRLESRFGAGLYGKNGFQLRFVPAREEIELVRRSVVLLKKPFLATGNELCFLELSVQPERNHLLISGRVWKGDEKRPDENAFDYKIFIEELLFPLAGRSTLFATPFSGEPVSFSSAKVYYGPGVGKGK